MSSRARDGFESAPLTVHADPGRAPSQEFTGTPVQYNYARIEADGHTFQHNGPTYGNVVTNHSPFQTFSSHGSLS